MAVLGTAAADPSATGVEQTAGGKVDGFFVWEAASERAGVRPPGRMAGAVGFVGSEATVRLWLRDQRLQMAGP
ncbi:hypothetical protein BCE75_110180 [Isoptericola sp. CG 20/1183]|uniref:Uncharacterized protein n=1 Tax=Isoptericola halotolerans TaxID=300560 RepID=A0ABX5EAN4_9MICO|nr:hypothetical protein BCL65_1101 [Isoptericola halotolerans]PRZ04762.1 hypothetical protein BCE75_110180 [Isoptericola sp. CG 20/1183]